MRRTLTAASGLLTMILALSACGGGGSSGGGSPMGANPVPVNPVATMAPVMPAPAPSAGATTATGQPGDAVQIQAHGQTILADAKTGLALYTFDGDTVPNQSTCIGSCLAIWPAHAAMSSEKGSNNFAIFTRQGGTLQWSFKGKPLYTFASDTPSNNATGDGFQNFHLAHP